MAAVSVPKTLDDLTDVTIVSPSTGQVLGWNGTAWAPTAAGGAGAQGPKGDPGVGVGIDVTAIGITAGVDFSAALQADFNGRSGPVNYYFPANATPYRYSAPVYLDRPYCGVTGAGIGLTTISALNGPCPPFVFGLLQNDNGQTVTAAYRPDAFGVMDSSLAGSPGNWKGYRTNANSYVVAVSSPAVYGVISSHGSRYFDSYGEVPALTVQVGMVFRNGTADLGTGSFSVVGLGGSSQPGPWWLGVDAGGLWTFIFRRNDGVVSVTRAAPNSTAAGVQRLRFSLDWVSGAYGWAQNGSPLAPTAESNMTGLAGKRFMRNRGEYFLWLGPSIGVTQGVMNTLVPDYTIMGCSVRNAAVTTEPATDALRYDIPNGDVTGIFSFDGSYTAASRTVRLRTSNTLTSKPEAFAHVIPCGGSQGGVKGNFLQDLKIDGGSVTVAQVLDFRMTRVECGNGFDGVRNIPTQVIYPVAIDDCQLGGFAYCLNLTGATPVRLRNTNFGGCGTVAAALFTGCDWTISGCEGEFFAAPGQEAWIISASDQFGGTGVVENAYADSEAGFVTRAMILVEKSDPGPLTTLTVSNFGAASIGTGAFLVELADKTGATGTQKGQARLSGLNAHDLAAGGMVKASASWYGAVELRGNADQRVTLATPGNFTVYT